MPRTPPLRARPLTIWTPLPGALVCNSSFLLERQWEGCMLACGFGACSLSPSPLETGIGGDQNVTNARGGGGNRPESCPSKTWTFDHQIGDIFLNLCRSQSPPSNFRRFDPPPIPVSNPKQGYERWHYGQGSPRQLVSAVSKLHSCMSQVPLRKISNPPPYLEGGSNLLFREVRPPYCLFFSAMLAF